jgi:hypothetical protein
VHYILMLLIGDLNRCAGNTDVLPESSRSGSTVKSQGVDLP